MVEIFKSACLNRAMTTSSLAADFKSHEDQRTALFFGGALRAIPKNGCEVEELYHVLTMKARSGVGSDNFDDNAFKLVIT